MSNTVDDDLAGDAVPDEVGIPRAELESVVEPAEVRLANGGTLNEEGKGVSVQNVVEPVIPEPVRITFADEATEKPCV